MRLALVVMVLLVAASATAETTVDELVASALTGHPELASIDERVDALDHAIRQTSAWPDAMVATEYSNMPILAPWPGNHPMSGIQLKLTQTVPFPTKFFARAEAATAERDAAVPMWAETRNRIESQVRTLVVRWRLARVLRGVTEQHIAAVDRLLVTVRSKYEIGRVELHDLVRLEVLRDRLDDDLTELDRQSDAIVATLNAVAQRPAGTALDLTATLDDVETIDSDVATLLGQAKADRPMLQGIEKSAAAERARARALRNEVWPDVTAWAGYRIRIASGADPGDNFVTAGVSVPLPWSSAFVGWEEKALALESRARSEQARKAAVELQLQGELDAALVRQRRAVERAKVYETTLIPGAKRTLEAAFSSYQVDRAGFAELFSAELDALEFERVAAHARAEAAQATIDIDTLTGRYAARAEEGKTP